MTRIVKRAIEKTKYNTKQTRLRGGDTASEIILSCIADGKAYQIKDPKLADLIFEIAKAKFKDESLIISQNLIRYFAYKIANENTGLILKVKNTLFFSNNPARLLIRVAYSVAFGIFAAATSMLPYAIFIAILTFKTTENSGVNCDRYFEELPAQKDGSRVVYVQSESKNLIIAGNDQAHQLAIYVPNTESCPVVSKENQLTRTYKKSQKKAKEIKFSEFAKNDPVLKKFKNLEEPIIPAQTCPLKPIRIEKDMD